MKTTMMQFLLSYSNYIVTAGVYAIVQSTIILMFALSAVYALKQKGPSVQSVILRTFLAGIFLSPVISVFLTTTDYPVFSLKIPHPEQVLIKNKAVSQQKSGKIFNAPTTDRKPVVNNDRTRETLKNRQLSVNTGDPVSQPAGMSNSSAASTSPPPALPETKNSVLVYVYLVLAASWILVTIILILRIIAANLYVFYLRSESFPAKPSIIAEGKRLSQELSVPEPVIVQNPDVSYPFLSGIMKHVVILPMGDIEKMMPVREILLHEYSHMIRRDNIWNQIRHIATAILPFQPLLWILSHWIDETSDYVCDDFVTQHVQNHRSYASKLTGLALYYQGGFPDMMGVSIVSVHTSLIRRVKRILDRSHNEPFRVSLSNICIIIFLCSVALLTTGLIGIHSKELHVSGAERILSGHKNDLANYLLHIFPFSGSVRHDVTVQTALQRTSSGNPVTVKNGPNHGKTIAPNHKIIPDASIGRNAMSDGLEKMNVIEPQTAPLDIKQNTKLPPSYQPESEVGLNTEYASNKQSPTAMDKSLFQQVLSESAALSSETTIAQNNFVYHDHGYSSAHHISEASTIIEPGKVDIITKWDKKHYNNSETLTVRDELDWHLSRGQKYPIWSPDGSAIAFTDWSGCGIWTLPLNGFKSFLIYEDTKVLKSEEFGFEYTIRGQHKQPLCFTPDGKEITFRDEIYDESRGSRAMIDEFGHLRSTSGYISVIRSVNIETKECRTVVEEASNGCWHPGGRFFIYTKTGSVTTEALQKSSGTFASIIVLDTETGEERLLVDNAHSPIITPDGSQVIYVENSWDNPQLYSIPFEGGEGEQLTSEGYWHQPSCTSDGKWLMSLVYDSTLPYNEDTWFRAVNLENGEIKDFYPPENFVFATMGNFSPNGTEFCYHLLETWESDEYDKYDCHVYVGDFPGSDQEKAAGTDDITPLEFAIKSNFPNPFNMNTSIEFVLDTDGPVTMEIFNIMGQRIRTLLDEHMPAGSHTVHWDGSNENRQRVASGTYIARLRMGTRVLTHSMTLVK